MIRVRRELTLHAGRVTPDRAVRYSQLWKDDFDAGFENATADCFIWPSARIVSPLADRRFRANVNLATESRLIADRNGCLCPGAEIRGAR